ncbi:MAG: glycosyltransferase [Alcanivoracaceae bacterium]|nr:glycosyltransferase [Alcanivoracaceae bacterium]
MNKRQKNKENIVLHDIFDIKGGGERLAISLVHALNADLGYGKHSFNSFDLSDEKIDKIYNLHLKLEFAGLKTWALSQLFSQKTGFLRDYKKVIYSGIICPLAIKNHQNGGNYYYCHTPPRFVYDKFEHYLRQNFLPQQMMMRLLVSWFRPQYEASVALMDVILTNSVFVKARIKKYLNRDSVVIHPPCNIQKFQHKPSQGYYLSTARFDALKRVDEIIKAFIKMPDKKLVLCSSGVEDKKLKKLAATAKNISFTGQVNDKELSRLIAESIATIYIPEDEDFGMSPVESMAAGKPVICSGHGGPTESVIDGETGLYIVESNIQQSLIDSVGKLDVNKATKMRNACENRALMFSEEIFQQKIQRYVLD